MEQVQPLGHAGDPVAVGWGGGTLAAGVDPDGGGRCDVHLSACDGCAVRDVWRDARGVCVVARRCVDGAGVQSAGGEFGGGGAAGGGLGCLEELDWSRGRVDVVAGAARWPCDLSCAARTELGLCGVAGLAGAAADGESCGAVEREECGSGWDGRGDRTTRDERFGRCGVGREERVTEWRGTRARTCLSRELCEAFAGRVHRFGLLAEGESHEVGSHAGREVEDAWRDRGDADVRGEVVAEGAIAREVEAL